MGQDHTIGGIQRYIFGLIDVFQEKYKIIIIQKSSLDFKKSFKNHLVYGFKTSKRNFAKELYSKIENHLNDQDIIIWASDRISTKINHKKVISIQHGITFDFLDYDNIYFGSILKKSHFLSYVYRLFQYKNAIKYFNTSPKVVCVDYNYINWVRTVMPRMLTLKATVIPNFAKSGLVSAPVFSAAWTNAIFFTRSPSQSTQFLAIIAPCKPKRTISNLPAFFISFRINFFKSFHVFESINPPGSAQVAVPSINLISPLAFLFRNSGKRAEHKVGVLG